ncbi:DapH/DapD/GlmU-related protein [Curtobacterium sp. 1310]|uniref:DapH/DapD/GlmU-related protein n=1 Tax=Curtobacterium sp. 1310 TaxID=2806570 RepID=UPI0035AC0D9C
MSPLCGSRLRLLLGRAAGHSLGSVRLRPGSVIRSKKLRVGDNVFINHDCFVDNGPVTIGDDVLIGPSVVLASVDHAPGSARRRAGDPIERPIVIGDGTWVGARVTVLGGVTIGPGCVIAAGAVVINDLEANGLYAGVPAVRKRDL